jgi:Lar family restriction alleviation protein
MPKSDEKLKACPWCGEDEQEKFKDEYNTFVRCQYCGALGPEARDYTSAKEEWNRRQP